MSAVGLLGSMLGFGETAIALMIALYMARWTALAPPVILPVTVPSRYSLMTAVKAKFAQLGFDWLAKIPVLASEPGSPCCLSLVFAWALGLEHPQ